MKTDEAQTEILLNQKCSSLIIRYVKLGKIESLLCADDLAKVKKKERGKGPKLLGLELWGYIWAWRLAFTARPGTRAEATLTAAPDQSH